MTRDNKSKLTKTNKKNDKSKFNKKNEDLKNKKKKNNDSDSDEDDYYSQSESESEYENDDLDVHEYRKFLAKIFPSKHIDAKVKAGEKIKNIENNKKNEDLKIKCLINGRITYREIGVT